jgi:hypothetical protein
MAAGALMLEHLLDSSYEPLIENDPGLTPVDKAAPAQTVDAQSNTADWLTRLGAKSEDEIVTPMEQEQARKSFTTLTVGISPDQTKEQLLQLQTPAAVRQLVGMLTAYDWEFVQQAKELRGYAVAKILEEVENPSANIRLKALGLLGKITEVGLFTEKIEVKKIDASDEEIERRIKEKLRRFMGVVDVVEVDPESDEPLIEPNEPEKPDDAD